MQIKEKIGLLPTSPGVYQFLNATGEVIYVGKAKNLRSRVSSYFVESRDHSAKVRALVRHIIDLRHIVVDTEGDALLLENNLIKELQPRYNILLKDSKSYPWICITNENFPRIFSTRTLDKKLGEYFGPYASIGMQRAVLELIKTLFPMRTCRHSLTQQNIEAGKFSICLENHIGNCNAPCVGHETSREYAKYVNGAREILRGNFAFATAELEKTMHTHATALRFEEAGKIQHKLELLENYTHRSIVVSPTLTDIDVVNLLIDDGAFCNRMRISGGAIVESYTFELKWSLDETPEELLAFALQNMEGLRREVVVPFAPSYEDPTHIYTIPQRGDKVKLLELSIKNCKLFRIEKLKYIEKTDPERHTNRLLEKMKAELRLPLEPRHIECFDNSNIQGTIPVASCVVFRDGRPSKRDYRHFNIKTVIGANDFASMHEILLRRYRRLVDEGEPLPQLIVIDGGKGQLGAAVDALQELGLQGKIEIVGLAKRMEEVFFPGLAAPLLLDKRGETLRVLMHIRDEAHRFGITFHRQKRSIAFLRSELEEVPGLGRVSIDKLLRKYKTVSRMRKAPQEEMAAIIGAQRTQAFQDFYLKKQ